MSTANTLIMRRLLTGLLAISSLGIGTVACEDGTGPEPVQMEASFNEWGGLATVVFEERVAYETLSELDARTDVHCISDQDGLGMEPRSLAVWLPGDGVPQRLANMPSVTDLIPFYDAPYGPVVGHEPTGTDTAMSGPVRVVATWRECVDGMCAPAVPDYRVLDHCAVNIPAYETWERDLTMSLENTADTVIILQYPDDAWGRFVFTDAERFVSEVEAVPFDLGMPVNPRLGAPSADTLAPGERITVPYLVSVGMGPRWLAAPAGTYRIEVTLNTLEAGPALNVFVRLSRPPFPD